MFILHNMSKQIILNDKHYIDIPCPIGDSFYIHNSIQKRYLFIINLVYNSLKLK